MEEITHPTTIAPVAQIKSDLLTIDKVATLLGRSIDAVHTMCRRNQIPHYKHAKRLYFSQIEVEATILSKKNRIETIYERNVRHRAEIMADQARHSTLNKRIRA